MPSVLLAHAHVECRTRRIRLREPAVLEVYRAWCKAFQSVDAEAMKSLFDAEFPGLIYQAEENPNPL